MPVNQLHHIDTFDQLLVDYAPSDDTIKKLQSIPLTLLLGVSSSGRNTIISELIKTGEYHFIVSDTTRKPRINNGILEQNGREYWFKTEEQVLDGLRNGRYVEAEVIFRQQVSGIHINEIEKAAQVSQIAINEVDKGGIQNILSLKPNTTVIFLLPPSFDEWQHRMRRRGEMEDREFVRRMTTARDIFALASYQPFTFVINDDLGDTVAQVHEVAHGKKARTDQIRALRLAKELEVKTSELLT